MNRFATILALSLLFGTAWADIKSPGISTAPAAGQAPFSFLPPSDSIFTNARLKPIQDLPDAQDEGRPRTLAVSASQMPVIPSLVYGLSDKQAKGLSIEIARFLAGQQSADKTIIQLPLTRKRKPPAFDAMLETALRAQGFAVTRTLLANVVQLNYRITRSKQQILVRLFINQTQVNRLYRDDLVTLTPFTLLKEEGQP